MSYYCLELTLSKTKLICDDLFPSLSPLLIHLTSSSAHSCDPVDLVIHK